MKTEKDVREMTAETVGKDLLQAMLAERQAERRD